MTGQVAEAEDAAREPFVKTHYALDGLRPGASFRPSRLRIVVGEASNRGQAARWPAGCMAYVGPPLLEECGPIRRGGGAC